MISPRQIEERELRKKRIIESALTVFQEKGIDGATMDEIASVAGFGKATLYYYFSSKEEVFSQIMENGWKTLWSELGETIQEIGSPREKFVKLLNKIVEVTLTDRNLYTFIFTASQNMPSSAEGNLSWKTYQQRMYRVLQELLDEGIALGEFPPVKSGFLMRAIGGLFHGFMFLSGGSGTLNKADIEQLITNLLSTENS